VIQKEVGYNGYKKMKGECETKLAQNVSSVAGNQWRRWLSARLG
jgi:hypothetical protein